MTNFDQHYASQSQVPGEPIFVLIQDDSDGDRDSCIVRTVSLDWLTQRSYEAAKGYVESLPQYSQMFILRPGTAELTQCTLHVEAGDKPGDGPKMVVRDRRLAFVVHFEQGL